MKFKLISEFEPSGDQPEAIQQLVRGVKRDEQYQTLLGVTGSGKTFTMANVIQELQMPTLILSHNKTLVAQLYGEFKQFFPKNAIEYFVSYYDYYQPEAYVSVTDTYIEKEVSINDEIEKLRLKATSSLLSGRKDVLVVASVSCIYGLGNPAEFKRNVITLKKGDSIVRNLLLHKLVDAFYSRSQGSLERGTFRVSGDTVDVFVPYVDFAYRLTFWGDELETIESFDVLSGKTIDELDSVRIFPATIYIAPKDQFSQIQHEIQHELIQQVEYFRSNGQHLEAKRLEERVHFDMEMIKELGYCNGIENYSRFFDRRQPGERPFCLLDYFQDDFLLFIDESHVTIPQIRGMYAGDRARKRQLVDYGFRLPAAMDNRPLTFDEFESLNKKVIYVSATPGDFELQKCGGVVVEQVVRPTGLLDPIIEVRPRLNQIDDLMDEIDERTKVGERVMVTTLTKRMAEELTKYFRELRINCRYVHSEVDTLERVEILRDLRLGKFDVLIGVNLLREGLDLPEVSLVAIMDADKEGFLRSDRSLTQIAGRAARNINGKVIMYADTVTGSMQRTIDETERRREKQIQYNEEHNITPKQIVKSVQQIMGQTSVLEVQGEKKKKDQYDSEEVFSMVAEDPVVQYMGKEQLEKAIEKTKKDMMKASKQREFLEAARLRDEMFAMQKILKEKYG